jgi:hypothetical protein
MIASGKSLSDAYRNTYEAKNMNSNSIHCEASRLMKIDSVKAKVGSLVKAADQQVVSERVATREQVLETLTSLMQEAQPSDTPKIRAAELLGKHHGIFAERIVVGPPERTSDGLAAEISQMLKAAADP